MKSYYYKIFFKKFYNIQKVNFLKKIFIFNYNKFYKLFYKNKYLKITTIN